MAIWQAAVIDAASCWEDTSTFCFLATTYRKSQFLEVANILVVHHEQEMHRSERNVKPIEPQCEIVLVNSEEVQEIF